VVESYQAQTRRLDASSEVARHTAAELGAAFRTEIDELGGLIQALRGTTGELGETVGGQASALARAHGESRRITEEIRRTLSAQGDQLVASERAVLERLTGIGQKVETIVGGLVRAAEGARTRVDGLGAAFDVQASALGRSVDEAYRRIEDYGQVFRDQAASLVDASEAAQARAEALQEREVDMRRDVFLRSATQMIEELNSTGIDLNRILADDMPDDIWKRYQKGDRSIFARRLLRGKDRLALPDIKARFETDERFRSEANRYIKQFETLLNQATDCDPENLLSTTFLTADVGKLYIILSRSLGRTQ
jgi:hypothetical protein